MNYSWSEAEIGVRLWCTNTNALWTWLTVTNWKPQRPPSGGFCDTMVLMLATPTVPKVSPSDFTAAFGGLPLRFELSQVSLAIVMAMVLIFFSVASVVLLYHWRRFPFEHDTFHRAERVYEAVSLLLVAIAVFGIFFS
jgi:hypothetical protein